MLTARRALRATRPLAAEALREPRFEVIPLPGVEEEVRRHLPPHATVTVTASPRRGLAPTLEVASRLALQGVHAVPHLSARSVADEAELADILERLASAGVREVFIIGGDPKEPAGDFAGALDLLQAMQRLGHEFTVGVAGYPETHPKISDDVTVQAMWDKRTHASSIVSQMCFDAQVLLEWVRRVRRRGVVLPIRVGIAGPATTSQLLRVSARVGVGQSMRVLSHHRSGLWRMAQPGTWRPDGLLQDLAPAFADPAYGLQGLHIYTFNAVAAAGRWWQDATTNQPGWATGDGNVDRERQR